MENEDKELIIKIFGYFAKYGIFVFLSILVMCAIISGVIHNNIDDLLTAILLFGFLAFIIIVGIIIGFFKD